MRVVVWWSRHKNEHKLEEDVHWAISTQHRQTKFFEDTIQQLSFERQTLTDEVNSLQGKLMAYESRIRQDSASSSTGA